jgi:hypothetical protein
MLDLFRFQQHTLVRKGKLQSEAAITDVFLKGTDASIEYRSPLSPGQCTKRAINPGRRPVPPALWLAQD